MVFDDLPAQSSIYNRPQFAPIHFNPPRPAYGSVPHRSPSPMSAHSQLNDRLPSLKSVLEEISGSHSLPLSPAHSTAHQRNESTESAMSAPQFHPQSQHQHQFGALPTPPCSSKEPTVHNFDDVDSHHGSGHDEPLLYSQHSPTPVAPLFAHPISTTSPTAPLAPRTLVPPPSGDVLTSAERHDIQEWREREWERTAYRQGAESCAQPSDEDFAIFLSAIRKLQHERRLQFRSEEWRHRQSSASSRRSILHETSPNKRRKVSKSLTLTKAAELIDAHDALAARPRASHHKRSAKVATTADGENKQRAQSTKPDKDPNFRHYPDFAPSLDNMDNAMAQAQAVKQFSGNFKHADHDPLFAELHPAEKMVAERLSLECSKFLCAKRQLFVGFVMYLRREPLKSKDGKDTGKYAVPSWNKTAGQNQTKIDVNKASYLWSFYNDIGCFRSELYADLVKAPSVQYHFDTTPSASP